MAITNQQAINFSNEQIRPMAERLRNLYYECSAMIQQWNSQSMPTLITNTADVIEDGRSSAPTITGADATNIITRAQAFVTMCEAAGVLDTITKPCVRAYRGS
jgi:hypothetical protein